MPKVHRSGEVSCVNGGTGFSEFASHQNRSSIFPRIGKNVVSWITTPLAAKRSASWLAIWYVVAGISLSSVGLGAEFFTTRNGSETGNGSDAGQGSLPPDRKYSPQYRASFWPFLDLTTSSLTPSSRRTVYLPFEVEK